MQSQMPFLQPSSTARPAPVSAPPTASVHRFAAVETIRRAMPGICLLVTFVLATLLSSLVVTAHAQTASSYMTYEKSIALLIGVTNYSPGWSDLPGVANDLDDLQKVLADSTRPYPFAVTQLMNPKRAEIRNSLEDVLVNEDYPRESRLLIFMSGHGYKTRDRPNFSTGRNFFIAADSPAPADRSAARGLSDVTAVGFDELVIAVLDNLFVRRRNAPTHVLLVFDSCLAGDIFETTGSREDVAKTLQAHENALNTNRQRYDRRKSVLTIMTSGSEDQEVRDDGFYVDEIIRHIDTPANTRQSTLPATVLASRLFRTYTEQNREHIPLFGKYTAFDATEGIGEFSFWLPAAGPR